MVRWVVLTGVGHLEVEVILLEIEHFFHQNLVFFEIFVLGNEKVVDGTFDITLSVTKFESSESWIVFSNGFAQSFLLDFGQGMKVDESALHDIRDGLIMRLFIEVSA